MVYNRITQYIPQCSYRFPQGSKFERLTTDMVYKIGTQTTLRHKPCLEQLVDKDLNWYINYFATQALFGAVGG